MQTSSHSTGTTPFDLAILDALMDPAAIIDHEQRIVAVNANWQRILGHQQGAQHQWIGGLIGEVLNAFDWNGASVAVIVDEIQALLTGSKSRFAVSCTGLLGFMDRADRVRGSRIDGFHGQYVLVTIDNTTPILEEPVGTWRGDVEQALVESRHRLKLLFESSNDAITVTDPDGCFREFNDAACDLFGCSREVLQSLSPGDGHLPAALAAARFAACRVGDDESGTFPFVRADGETRIAEYSTRALPDGCYLSILRDVTERRRAEDALRQIAHGVSATTGERFFRSLVQYLATTLTVEYVLVCELDPNDSTRMRTIAASEQGVVVDNRSFSIEGSPCELVIHNGLRCFPSEVRSQFPDDRLISELEVDSFIGTPLFDSAGLPLGLLCVLHKRAMTNIPFMESILRIFAVRASAELERKRSQAALVESEQRYRRLVESSPDGILIQKRGLVVYANQAALLLLRAETPHEVIGRPFLDRVGIEYREQERRRLHQLEEDDMSVDLVEQKWTRTDGGAIIVEVAGTTCTHDGESAVQIVFRDITERKLAEDQLRRKTSELQRIFDVLPDLYLRLDSTGLILDSQGRVDELAPGLESLDGRYLTSVIPRDVAHSYNEAIRQVREGGSLAVVDDSITIDDEDRHFEARIVPFLEDQMIVVIRDITRRRRLEEDLRQAQRIEAIGQLASGIAHDFNNLLTAIFSQLKLAKRRLEPDHPARVELDAIDEAACQAGAVTKSLLTFSRRAVIERRPVRLSDAVERSTRLLHGMLPGKVELNVDLSAEPEPWVRANSTQIQQIVVNLAINARDAMPEGGQLDIGITVVPGPPAMPQLHKLWDRPCACLRVADTGVGIPPANLQRIFDPFFTTKPREQGTGLGLSVIHGIVKEHGGEILVDSRVSQGTVFSIFLPTIAPEPESADDDENSTVPSTRVLLVERDTQIREIMAGMLENIGCEVRFELEHAAVSDVELVVIGDARTGADDTDAPELRELQHIPTVIIPPDGCEPADAHHDIEPVILTRPFRMADLRDAIQRARLDT